jgi:replicative DNA helicase
MDNGIDAELAVIAGVLLSNGGCLDDLSLSPSEFYNPKYAKTYEVMLGMRNRQEPIDAITLYENPEFRKQIWTTPATTHEWTGQIPTAANITYYAQLVTQANVRRQLTAAGLRIAERAKDADYEQLVELARGTIDKALGVAKTPITFIYDEIHKTIEELSQPSQAFKTPWLGLTSAIGGWRKGALYIIGARPGKGKTSIGLQAAIELSKYGSVALSSLEMRREEIHKRLMATQASIPMDALMNNKMTDRDWEKWAVLRPSIQPAIAIDDRAEVSIQDIRIHARSVNREKPLSAIVVDYLQLMTSRDNRPRHEVVAEFSRQLKIMARELNVPVIALSQLNRSSESRIDRRPSLGDLRESGAIEQDADVVILLHIDEEDTMTLDVAKNRHGAQAVVKLNWEGQYARAV